MERETKILASREADKTPKINFNGFKFVNTLKVAQLLKELGPEAFQLRFDIAEVVSNLDRMFSRYFDTRHDIEIALDDAMSGERSSLTPIRLPVDLKEKYRNLLLKKIEDYITENLQK